MTSTAGPAPAVHLEALEKSYGTGFVLGPVALTVGAGETVAILGKNGAGKSTLFQLLTGNLDATAGTIRLAGERLTPDTALLKRRLGYLPQDAVLPRWVTAREILGYAARLHGLADADDRVAAALAYWDCAAYAAKPLAALSFGTQRRVGLALATLHAPAVLVLDEPHSGLDLFHVKALDDVLAARRRAGQTTIFSTHVAQFAASLGDRALVVEAGRVRELDTFAAADAATRTAAILACFFGAGAARAP